MKYPGGKGKCYQRLINLMPAHTTYIESHLGGGAVLRNKQAAQINIGIDADEKVIATWQQRYPNYCTLVHGDAVSFLEQYDYQGGELIYADPPYLPDSRRNSKIYRHEYSHKDHSRLLDVLIDLPCMVMLSGYDNSMYELRLGNWRKATFLSKTHVDVRTECVWMNFPPPTRLHDTSYLGETYRDRQTNKRRHQRLFDRFDRMEPVEREYVLRALNAQYLTESRSS